jgi:hypothetical protein
MEKCTAQLISVVTVFEDYLLLWVFNVQKQIQLMPRFPCFPFTVFIELRMCLQHFFGKLSQNQTVDYRPNLFWAIGLSSIDY